MVVDLAVAEQAEQPLDLVVADGAAQADAVDVAHRNEHGGVVGDDPKMVEAAGGTEDGLVFDPFDDPETMVRVNDLVADFKCHGSPCKERSVWKAESRASSPLSIAHGRGRTQRQTARKRGFSGHFGGCTGGRPRRRFTPRRARVNSLVRMGFRSNPRPAGRRGSR